MYELTMNLTQSQCVIIILTKCRASIKSQYRYNISSISPFFKRYCKYFTNNQKSRFG